MWYSWTNEVFLFQHAVAKTKSDVWYEIMAIWNSSKWAVPKVCFLLSSHVFSLYCLQETLILQVLGVSWHNCHVCILDTYVVSSTFHIRSFVFHLMGWPHTLVNGYYYAVFHCIGYEVSWRKIGGKWCFYADIPLLYIQFFRGGREEEGRGNLYWQVKTFFYFMDCVMETTVICC